MLAIVIGIKKEPKNFTTKKGDAQSFTTWLLCRSNKVIGFWSTQEQIADYMLQDGVSLSVGSVVSLFRTKGDDGVYRLRRVYPVSDAQLEESMTSFMPYYTGGEYDADVV